MASDFLTTGEVAKIMSVSAKTVGDWLASGVLKAYVLPGSKHHRVERKHLRELMKDLGVSEERLSEV